MSLTPRDLRDVEAASKRERDHYADHVKMGCEDPVCYCPRCKFDRETIAKHTPEIMSLLREWMQRPRRAHFDLGELD